MHHLSARALHRLSLAAEATILAILAGWLIRRGWLITVVLLPALAVAVRMAYAALLTLAAFILFHTPEATRPFSLAWFRLVWRAGFAILRNQWAMALPPPPAPNPLQNDNRALVLLIHGYACNAGCFLRLPERLATHGLETRAITLPQPLGDIDAMGQEAVDWIVGIHATVPRRPLVLAAVSMGGIVARAALASKPDLPLAHLVTISSPHAGTWMAFFGLGKAARQMQPGSDLLTALNQTQRLIPSTAIWTPDDAIILPSDSGKLSGAAIVTAKGYTHLAVIESVEVEETITQIVRRIEAEIPEPRVLNPI